MSHPLKDALVGWYLDWWCRHGWHSWDSVETDEKIQKDIFGMEIEYDALYRACTQCDKTQRLEWFVWRDVHDIPPARLLNEGDR